MIIFRADANASIGCGHIMRCLSLADAAASFQQEVLFISEDEAVQALAAGRGYKTAVRGTAYGSLEEEAEAVCVAVEACNAEALIVDSYAVTEPYLHTLWDRCRRVNCRLVYMDDVLAFPYPCDVLINYNIYGPDADYDGLYKGAEHTPEFLLGTAFAPLRREFWNLPPRNVRKDADRIFISTGGTDSEHLTLALVSEMEKSAADRVTFHLVIGELNADRNRIRRAAERLKNVVLHENVRNMCALMQASDVAVSAAGSTLYELCATQTPTLTFILADNQIPGADGFERHGILQNCGDVRELGREALAQRLVRNAVCLCGDYEKRCGMTERMAGVADGRGAYRAAGEILNMFL